MIDRTVINKGRPAYRGPKRAAYRDRIAYGLADSGSAMTGNEILQKFAGQLAAAEVRGILEELIAMGVVVRAAVPRRRRRTAAPGYRASVALTLLARAEGGRS